MKNNKIVPSSVSFAKRIFSNIMREQYLHGVSDAQLSNLLGVTQRTLYNYRQDPSNMTIKQLQAIIESFGVEPETLFRS